MSDTNQDQIYIDEIARALSERRAAIMVGSGFSKNASPKFPNWQELGDKLFERLYSKKPENKDKQYLNVLRLAGELESVHGRAALDAVIRGSIPDVETEPSEVHRKLLACPWVDVFTTNYDTLLERASKPTGLYDTIIGKEDLVVLHRNPRIVKLHGSFPSQRPFVITEEDYRRYPKNNAVFVNTVQQSLIENLFCLIGFSGDDPNFLNWIGWVRDNLGTDYTEKIYLLDVSNKVSLPQRSLLSRRNIITVDLRQWYREQQESKNNTDPSHAEIIKSFLNYISDKSKYWDIPVTEPKTDNNSDSQSNEQQKQEERNPSDVTYIQPRQTFPSSAQNFNLQDDVADKTKQWNTNSSPQPNPQNNVGSECERIIKEWRQIRESYPGWVVLPYRERNNLWTLTQQWRRLFYSNDFSKLSPELQYEFTYEIIWRVNKCLYPIDEAMIEPCNIIINDTEWKTKETDKWFEIVLTLLREYRTTRNEQKWNDLAETMQKECSRLLPEQWSVFCYEKSLNALFSVDTAKLRKTLDDWAEVKNAPLLEAKKAALWAELGELEKAKTIVGNALETVREQQNAASPYKQKALFSQEGCILSIYRCIELAEASSRQKYDNQQVSDNIRHRLDALRQYRCDITEEQLVFSTALRHEPAPPPTAITVKSSFDIGTVNYTQHLFNEDDKEMLLGYSYLIFAEETGIPFKLSNVNFDKDSAVGAAKRIRTCNFRWAFITLLRMGEVKEVDTFFNREDVAAIKQVDVDYYASLCMNCLDGIQSEIARLNNPHIAKNLAANYAEVIPEMLSRLCTKCSPVTIQKILEYLVKLYNLPKKDKQAFRGVAKLVQRLMNVYPTDDSKSIFDALKQIDYKSDDNWLITVCGFINPYWPFINRLDDKFQPTTEDREFALSLLEKNRDQGMGLCFAFYNSFNEKQVQCYTKRLWDAQFLDAGTGFPQSGGFLCSAFAVIPAPNDINVMERFKKYSLEDVKGKDIFDNRDETTQTAANTSFSMTGGYSWMAQEWESGYGIFSQKPIELNAEETRTIFNYVHTYWSIHNHHLNERSDPFFSVPDEYKSRFQTLLRIFAFVVIPNAVKNKDEEIKEDIDQLLTEMSDAGLNIGLAKVASLALFPERQSDTQTFVRQIFSRFNKQEIESVLSGLYVLLMMKHKDISFELDTHWAVGCIVEHIQNWLSPALYFALIYLADIIEKAPQYIEENHKDQIIADILPTLGVLASETDMQKQDARIEFADRLTCRKACMRLAFTISKCDQYRDELPAEVQKWKDIADSTGEFWEIRNEWK